MKVVGIPAIVVVLLIVVVMLVGGGVGDGHGLGRHARSRDVRGSTPRTTMTDDHTVGDELDGTRRPSPRVQLTTGPSSVA